MDFLRNLESLALFFKSLFGFLSDYIMVLNVGKYESKLMIEFPEKIEAYLIQQIDILKEQNPGLFQKEYQRYLFLLTLANLKSFL